MPLNRQFGLGGFMQSRAAHVVGTKDLEGKRHDDLQRQLRDRAGPRLPGSSRIALVQCLQDAADFRACRFANP